MARDEFPKLIRDLLYGADHRLFDDDFGRALVGVVGVVGVGVVGVADDFVRDSIANRVSKHKIAQAFAGPFALPHLNTGELTAGFDQRDRLVRFPVQYLNGHTLTLGGSGSGKTTRSRFMVLQIAPRINGVWIFDLRKREYAVLRPLLNTLGVDLVIVPGRSLRLNPLQVPTGVVPEDWAPRVADVLVHVLGLPPRATKLLHTTLLALYQRFGTYNDPLRGPCMFDLYEAVADNASANAQAKQATLDSLEPVLMSLRSVLCYRRGWTTDDLAKRKIVFELGGLAEVDKDLILNSLLLSEFASRIARGVSNLHMDLWICCDEAQRLASSSGRGLSDLIGLVRGTGIGLDLSIQSADVSPAILSNTASKFVGRCGSATDYETLGAAMGLTTDQRRWMSLNLRPGLFVGQVGEGDWRHPFLCRVPPMTLPTTLASQDSGMDTLLALPTGPANEFLDWQPRGSSSSSARVSTTDTTASSNQDAVSDADLRYLRAIVDHPGRPSTEYAKLAGIGTRKAREIRKRLVGMGYLREHKVNTSARGRTAIVLEPLEPALRAVGASLGGTT